MSVPDLEAFREWCDSQQRWSRRAVSDLVSRVRRADRVVSLGEGTQLPMYLPRLRANPEWSSIPEATQRAVERAVKLYLEFRTQRPTAI